MGNAELDLIWSPKQDAALRDVAGWLADPYAPKVYKLWGFAGTGKTTLAKHLAEHVDGLVLFAAYTGKAASVLRRSGCPGAATIHSLLYSVAPASQMRLLELEQQMRKPGISEYALAELRKQHEVESARVRRPSFSVNPENVIKQSTLLVLDECSMVNDAMADDIERYAKKVLVLGDPAQLPPVRGNGRYAVGDPDTLLTEIHRQALDSPIVRWGKIVREGGIIPPGIDGAARRIPRAGITDEVLSNAGQILTGKNETRRLINTKVRTFRGFTTTYPARGERIVILRNAKDYGVLNGVTCETMAPAIRDGHDPEFGIQLRLMYEGYEIPKISICRSQFDAYVNPLGNNDYDFRKRWLVPADYGYALTVHKAQGSQWEDVLVYDDGFAKREGTMRRRWLYTAITRAQHTLTIAY